jgi:hypothetical protein
VRTAVVKPTAWDLRGSGLDATIESGFRAPLFRGLIFTVSTPFPSTLAWTSRDCATDARSVVLLAALG